MNARLLLSLMVLFTVPARAQTCPDPLPVSKATLSSYVEEFKPPKVVKAEVVANAASEPIEQEVDDDVRCVRAWALTEVFRRREARPENCGPVFNKLGLKLDPLGDQVSVDLIVGSDVTRVLLGSMPIYVAKATFGGERRILLSLDAGTSEKLTFEANCKPYSSRQLDVKSKGQTITVGRSVKVAPAWTSSKIRIDDQLVSAWPVFLTGDEHVVSVEGAPRCRKRLGTDTTIEFEPSCRDEPPSLVGGGFNSRVDFTSAGTQRVVGVLAGGAVHFRIFDAFTPRLEAGALWSGEHVGVVAGLGAELGRLSIFSFVPMVELAYTSISPSSGDTSVVALHPHLRLRFGSVKWAGYVSGGGYFILDKSLSSDDVIKRYVSLSLGFEGRWFP
jgi:hypothetical protein